VFDYATQDKLYQDLHAMAQANQAPVDRGAPSTATPVAAAEPGSSVESKIAQAGEAVIAQAAAAAPAPAPVEGQVKASSKKSKK
jgi:hypothetical protein